MTQRRIYQDEYPYFITFRTREDVPLFDNDEMAEMLAGVMFKAGELKRYDILAYQIMPDHVHLLAWCIKNDRTLENVRSGLGINISIPTERTLSRVRSHNNYNISDLSQSIKGNFSRKLHMGNIWRKRFYTRIVDSEKYLHTVIHYIKHNPTKAKLPGKFCRLPYQFFNFKKLQG